MRVHTWEPLVPTAPLAAESPGPPQGGAIRRRWLVALFVLLLAGGPVSERLAASLRVYTRRERTTAQPHQQSNLGGNPLNNYRFPGNSHTSLEGYRNPDFPKSILGSSFQDFRPRC
jgi:hypothetical protein